MGDQARIRQIAINLLSNGVKFTDAGEVVVEAGVQSVEAGSPSRYRLQFAVRDTGIGIPADRIDRLFQSFSQVDASTSRKYGGTGLGLAISKRLVEEMGGEIWIESDVGSGTTVRFTLDLPGVDDTKAPVTVAPTEIVGLRVLVADHSPTSLRLISQYTRSWGMLPRVTTSPKEALDWLQRGESFDLAIIDETLAAVDGEWLHSSFWKSLPGPEAPVIFYHPLGQRAAGTVVVGPHSWLAKPVKASALFDVLVEHFVKPGAGVQVEGTVAPDRQLVQPQSIRILLAEDNMVNQKLALRMLETLGYSADVAENGIEALSAMERHAYDVVLMDVQMPEMDGWEATREIRRRWPLERQPRIIAVTANALKGDAERCFEAGMDEYVSKPIRSADLKRAIEAVSIGR
jgi:CheY-like chemotaxis protein